MRKGMLLLALTLLLAALTGCTGAPKEMTLTPIQTELSGENAAPSAVFSYEVGAPAKSVTGTLHIVRNGSWESRSFGGVNLPAHKGRVGLVYDMLTGTMGMAVSQGDQLANGVGGEWKPDDAEALKALNRGSITRADPFQIELEKEVIVQVQAAADGDRMVLKVLDDLDTCKKELEQLDYPFAAVLTLTFSEEKIEGEEAGK